MLFHGPLPAAGYVKDKQELQSMTDAEIPFVPMNVALPARDGRVAPLLGLGLAALASSGLWGLLALFVSRLI